jgi:hypothetical protein
MKKIIFAMMVAAGLWWHFIGGRSLNEAQVTEFYRSMEVAGLERKPEALCDLLATDFKMVGKVSMGAQAGQPMPEQDKAQTCKAYTEMYASWEKLGEKMGGVLQLDSDYKIHSIEIAADKKSATVDVSGTLDVAGSIMNIRSRTLDTLERRNGKVRLLRSEGRVALSAGS